MKLEYSILWIDNDLQSYIDNGSVQSIEEFLSERGFEPIIEKLFDEGELNQFISKHKYDLIISDYNLNNTTGDKLIVDIRNVRKLDTEILFYTAQSSYKNNPEVKDRLAFIERLTFQVGRETLLDKIEKVIILTLSKLLELNATRGLITATTSDLDVLTADLAILIQKSLLKKSDDELDSLIRFYIDDFLAKSPSKFLKRHLEIGFENSFRLIEASRKWGIFRDSLKEFNKLVNIEDIKTFLDFNKSYNDDVIEIRNKFAHAKAEEDNGKLVLKAQLGKEDFVFDSDACIQIRRRLIAHKKSFEILKELLSSL